MARAVPPEFGPFLGQMLVVQAGSGGTRAFSISFTSASSAAFGLEGSLRVGQRAGSPMIVTNTVAVPPWTSSAVTVTEYWAGSWYWLSCRVKIWPVVCRIENRSECCPPRL